MRKALAYVVVAVLILVVVASCLADDSPNEKVVKQVQKHYKNDAWMKHVTHWHTRFGLSVETDYPPDELASYRQAYEICQAVKSEYAHGANDLPRLRIYGADTTTKVKIDGSKSASSERIVLAESALPTHYLCAITPTRAVRAKVKELGLRVSGR